MRRRQAAALDWSCHALDLSSAMTRGMPPRSCTFSLTSSLLSRRDQRAARELSRTAASCERSRARRAGTAPSRTARAAFLALFRQRACRARAPYCCSPGAASSSSCCSTASTLPSSRSRRWLSGLSRATLARRARAFMRPRCWPGPSLTPMAWTRARNAGERAAARPSAARRSTLRSEESVRAHMQLRRLATTAGLADVCSCCTSARMPPTFASSSCTASLRTTRMRRIWEAYSHSWRESAAPLPLAARKISTASGTAPAARNASWICGS
mmetsp:Transcript_2787/g.9833  ORF Transcript_2787/g.9833 Transcript_2787/m.9833 type:complete len:270 (-) Transcript_2787:945-1754(-)